MKQRLLWMFVCVASLMGGAFAADTPQTVVTEADDAYHFENWEGSPHNASYTEWWYFNLYDANDNVQAIFTYQVVNPLDLGGLAAAAVTVVVYQPNKMIPETDIFPLSAFTASYSAADLTMGADSISVSGPSTYNIMGATNDGRLNWNLQYQRDAASWFAADHANVAPAPWEKMSWLVYMPGANVTGTLTVDGHTYNVNCGGYHDHNWGQWDFQKVLWNWAQYSQPGLAFDLGDFDRNQSGRAGIEIAGQRFIFNSGEYTLIHTKWAFDQQDNIPYPVESVFTAQNNRAQVNILLQIQKTQPLLTGEPPSLVIYEQTSHFTGSLTPNGAAPINFAGDGFAEYTSISKASQ